MGTSKFWSDIGLSINYFFFTENTDIGSSKFW